MSNGKLDKVMFRLQTESAAIVVLKDNLEDFDSAAFHKMEQRVCSDRMSSPSCSSGLNTAMIFRCVTTNRTCGISTKRARCVLHYEIKLVKVGEGQ